MQSLQDLLPAKRGMPNGPVALAPFDLWGSKYGAANVTARFDWDVHAVGGLNYFMWPLGIAAALYVPVIVVGLERLMRNRESVPNLKVPLVIWNIGLSVFSLLGAAHTVPQLIETINTYGFATATCDNRLYYTSTGYWVYWFCMSKTWEFVDTVFLRLKKRPVILLHWYHHICTMSYCVHGTWGIVHGADASGWFFAAINLCVHTIMYAYYALASAGLHKPLQRMGADMVITSLQITQMVVGVCVLLYSAGCPTVNLVSWRWGIVMYLSYVVLFADMARNKYCSRKAGDKKGKKRD